MDDTSPEARKVYYRRLAEMTPAERVRIAVSLCEASDRLQRAALRQRYPDADEAEILFRLAASRYGEDLARRVYKRRG
jgi:hypothetical protein